MIKKTLYFTGMLVFILASGLSTYLYEQYQQRQFEQNRSREIRARLMITQNLDDQLGKEEKHHVVKKDENLSKISFKNKINIQKLKVINEISSEKDILSNLEFN